MKHPEDMTPIGDIIGKGMDGRLVRSRQNRRGRKKPAKVPSRLTRTSAFVPRYKNLATDSTFERTYVVPGHSVIRIKGRELGSKHRDALYAVFRLNPERISTPDGVYYRVETTWRQLIQLTGKSEHKNNLRTLLNLFEDFQQVVIEVQFGAPKEMLEEHRQGRLGGPGYAGNVLSEVAWDGTSLDSHIVIKYGRWVREAIERKHLVSLNAEVQFKLKSDYAKSFWPYIDSQPKDTSIQEGRLAELVDLNLWEDQEVLFGLNKGKVLSASKIRAQFRKDCKQAFDDMVQAGGLATWGAVVTGEGWKKGRIYYYLHALPRQLEMEMKGSI